MIELDPDWANLMVISDSPLSPYSGLLTGHIAGIYREEEIYIQVGKLTKAAGGHFIEDSVCGIDFDRREVITEKRGRFAYDLLSINCGARPKLLPAGGASDQIIPVKPTKKFQTSFHDFLNGLSPEKSVHIVQIGGGVAGIECAAGYRRRLTDLKRAAKITLIDAHPVLLPGHNGRVRAAVTEMLRRLDISILLGDRVASIDSGVILTENGKRLEFDFAAQATPAHVSEWVEGLDLAHLDGFIRVDAYLQTSRAGVFAAGDVAQNAEKPTARAGVYAVREAPVLWHNILATLKQKKLKRFRPQRNYLNLIMDGHGRAIASRGWFYFPRSRLMWWLKNAIDKKFVTKLNRSR